MSRRFLYPAGFMFLSFLSIQAGEIGPQVGEIEIFPGGSWTPASSEFLADHWHGGKLAEAEKAWKALSERGQSTGLMVVHKGWVVREFGDCETPVPCHSVRKSFLSAVFGAWIEEGGENVDELLSTTIAEVPLTEKGGIPEIYQGATLRQLLKSCSGMPLPAEYESAKYFEARSKKPHAQPGERWAYNNWDFNALGTAFHEIAGLDLFQTFDDSIAKPIGMEDFVPADHTAWFPAKGKPTKSMHPAYLFEMSARDRARFGLLFLSGGKWGDERIIDEEWFERSVMDTIPAEGRSIDYGYMWWVGVGGQKKTSFPGDRTFSARGNGGQYIFVIPSRDLVIVHARDTADGTDFDSEAFNEIFRTICEAQKGRLRRDPLAFGRHCETLVPKLQAELNVPGVAMAVVNGEKIVWSEEFGVRNVKTGEPVTPRTRFEGASTTKPAFSYPVMKLVEEGALDLDRPLVEYLAEPYMENDDRYEKITARMVLSHRTGFPNWRKGGYSANPDPPRLKFEPGSRQGYSGEGFTLLQTAVEEITGMDFAAFTRAHLLDPLEMTESSLRWDDTAEIAAAHHEDGTVRRDTPRYRTGNSAYSLFTTATDYAKYLIEMLRVDRTADHSISEETRAEMLRSHSDPEDERDLALSWMLRPKHQGGFYHMGSNTGFRAGVWFDPESGTGLVILTNSVSGEKLRDRIFAEALGSW